jgi:solute carrier family 45 protein 1/2/4
MSGDTGAYQRSSRKNSFDLDSPKASGRPTTSSLLNLENGTSDSDVGSTGELAGLYFGILNIYTTLPQFIGTFISMIVFSILEPGKSPELAKDAHPSEHHGTDGPNAISVCLFIGAICTIMAAFKTKQLKDLHNEK